MRSQEVMRLRELAHRLDLDWKAFDYVAYSYRQIKEQMLKTAGQKDEQMEEDEFLAWESQAEHYDSLSFEEKTMIPNGVTGVQMLNCLVVQFSQRHFKFAVDILSKTFKGNFMWRTSRVLENPSSHRVLWFVGLKETTNRIQDELARHSIWFRVMRDSYFRRDFVHYYNGKIYPVSKKVFREMNEKASIREEKKLAKILA